jgi:hypothetical protein
MKKNTRMVGTNTPAMLPVAFTIQMLPTRKVLPSLWPNSVPTRL